MAYRADVEARLRRAERDRAAATAKAEEQRKRRRVQLALAGVVLLVAVGAGVGANVVQRERAEKRHEADRLAAEKQRAEDTLAAEKQRAEDNLAAERKRQDDLRAAQRQTRADALVDALTTADTVAVPRVLDDLKEFRHLSAAKLRKLAEQPVRTKPGLHARCALLAEESKRAEELGAYLPVCKSEELLTIRELLGPYAGEVAPDLWTVLTDGRTDAAKRVRAACALAGLQPGDLRWNSVAPAVAGLVVLENPLEAAVWFRALEPVRGALVPALAERYPDARRRLRGGKLDEVRLAAEVSGFDLTATALVQYTRDRPAEATELMLVVDPRHAPQFLPVLAANKGVAVPVLEAELARKARAGWTDAEHETLGRRRGQAAAVLLTLGHAEPVWPLFAFPRGGDPTTRSYLLARLVDLGANPSALIRRFEVEPDVSAKRALLIALGGFPPDAVPAAERGPLTGRLLTLYREHPDPGLHGAIDWLLRQKWGNGQEVAAIDRALARQTRGAVAARTLADAVVPVGRVPLPIGPQLPAPRVAAGKGWFVNGEGQTFTTVRGPVEFVIGSPATEPGRIELSESAYLKRIPRSFAVATKEVTVEQFLRFRPNHEWLKGYSPGPDTPAVQMTWYEAAEYCNWLSAREGVPESQWCYEPNRAGSYNQGMRIKPGHLGLSGYRLPTEAEWEFACRSGAVTAHYYGRGEDLLPRYGRFAKNADDRTWPVGQLRPNESGLFDVLGNALEWIEDPALVYATSRPDDVENGQAPSIDERTQRILRGGSFFVPGLYLRSAVRSSDRPGERYFTYGFRPVRTLVD